MKVIPYNKNMAGESENLSPASGFIGKLWHLVNCESTNNHIRWTENGDGFHITNGAKLAEEILPVYFKHNNISSFVRQLNMYGFRKVNRPETGLARMNSNDLQFTHPNFHRDKGHLLRHIHRKNVGNHRSSSSPINDNMGVTSLDVYRKIRDDGEEFITERDLNQLLLRFERLKQAQDESLEMITSLRSEKEKLRMQVERLMDNCQRNNFIINQLVNIFLPRMSSEQISHLHGLTKRQITASEDGQSSRMYEDMDLTLAGLNTDDTATTSRHGVSNVDGQRPAKIRRAVVIPSKTASSGTTVQNFQSYSPPTGGKRRRTNGNSGLVIEELKDEQVLHSKPATTQRPLRVIMPTTVGKNAIPKPITTISNSGHQLTLPLIQQPVETVTIPAHVQLPKYPNPISETKMEIVPTSSSQPPLIRTPSLTFSTLDELTANMSPDPMSQFSPFANEQDVSDVTDQQFGNIGSIIGNKSMELFDESDLVTSSSISPDTLDVYRNNAAPNHQACEAHELDSLLDFGPTGNHDDMRSVPEPYDPPDAVDDFHELLNTSQDASLSLGLESEDPTLNSPSSPPLLAPSLPRFNNVSIVQQSESAKKPSFHIR